MKNSKDRFDPDDDFGPLYTLEDSEKEEGSPLYEVEDEDRQNFSEKSDPLYDVIDEDEEYTEEEEETEEPVEEKKRISPFRILIRTLLTPVEGWKSLKRARFSPEEFANGCFFPLIALAAISETAKLFYEANHSVSEWLLDALCTFLSFFFGYFTIVMAGGWILPSKSRDFLKKDIGKEFVMLNLSSLALFWTLLEVVPMLDPVLVFLPIWTIYLIYKGVRVIRVPSEVENSTTGYLCLLILGIPLLWNWLLTEILIPLSTV